MSYFVYILASRKHGTLYVGVTNDIARRIDEHRNGIASGFTKKYQVHRLVYAETHDDVNEAIGREKAIKEWKRAWKVQLIEKANPEGEDLTASLNR
ncbi:GIY-YIG nuclease family protein [Parvibaculum sp.]|uniref:GIY-YIG nuclease family protein n=1 Tax=Parvibaculum sp. TaxID=2024848 RepID=UPI002731A0C2|nr:GIY-YIG nuclease family protein [Parvibaculum sp.]MDP1626836.1 GIY-YIG nuclease family protein [Parvibaculum sp.]MDP2148482.1 GIY-YIG nuclease family protein [Parvibaculum sp.]MDP3327000.1 GIY-YIG nuclease family protein [Parvibaculum sp.]